MIPPSLAKKQAAMCEEQERKKLMSKSFSHQVAKKLKETILKSTDPKEIASLANQLAKFLPKATQPRGSRKTETPIKAKEPGLDDMVAALEKQRKGLPLTAEELKMVAAVAAVEKKRKEARDSITGGSAEVAK